MFCLRDCLSPIVDEADMRGWMLNNPRTKKVEKSRMFQLKQRNKTKEISIQHSQCFLVIRFRREETQEKTRKASGPLQAVSWAVRHIWAECCCGATIMAWRSFFPQSLFFEFKRQTVLGELLQMIIVYGIHVKQLWQGIWNLHCFP